MKVMVVPIIGALGTIPKGLVKWPEEYYLFTPPHIYIYIYNDPAQVPS